MSRRTQRRASSGAPGLTNAAPGRAALNPLSLAAKAGKNGLYLDPTAANIPHPSARWAGMELQPIKPREDR